MCHSRRQGRSHRAATLPHVLGAAHVDRPRTRVPIHMSSLHQPTVAAGHRVPKRGSGTAALMSNMVSLCLTARAHALGAWHPRDVRLSAPSCRCRCASRDVPEHASPPLLALAARGMPGGSRGRDRRYATPCGATPAAVRPRQRLRAESTRPQAPRRMQPTTGSESPSRSERCP